MKNLINKLASVSLVVTLSFSLGWFHDLFDGATEPGNKFVQHSTTPTKPRP